MKDIKKLMGIIGSPESELIEYKAVLPPARTLAKLISAFANSNGGYIVLGVSESQSEIKINGLSSDFRANSVTHKAIDLIEPRPSVQYDYINHKEKRLFAIQVEKSDEIISLEGKVYKREGSEIFLSNPEEKVYKTNVLPSIVRLSENLNNYKKSSTSAKSKFIDHYQSVLNIIDDLETVLYPQYSNTPTNNTEGKILTRILFSSCVDNFETYLSELLYEIYLANPATLKSGQHVTIKEVLECNDMQEFVIYWSKRKLSKLQRGSVKGFIAENNQIKNLNVMDENQQDDIEKIFQIRHLYSHRNGIIDEKFLQYYSAFSLNEEHQMAIEEVFNHLSLLLDSINRIDKAAIDKYNLATID
tara:strand:- start:2727 stop:3803 length:1077 start_codon:yes stop_codon:yes gene_type:complete